MPELPEVETIARDLRRVLCGQKVIKAQLHNNAIWEGSAGDLHQLRGQKLQNIERRGKNLIFRFSDGWALVGHLKMTGRMIIGSLGPSQAKHLHFLIDFEKDRLSFYDTRKFGRLCLLPETSLFSFPRLARLGPEPFEISPSTFAQLVKKRKRAIKLVLMDQQLLAGVGNIYADEALFCAGIRPSLPARSVATKRLIKLHACLIDVLWSAIRNRGTSVNDYLDGRGRKGKFQRLVRVYGREGDRCYRCRTVIRRIRLSGRSSYYCPSCQK